MGVYDEERHRVNPFDWDKEFPEIIKPAPAGRKQGTGGFDVVIGNPPYGGHSSEMPEKNYFREKFTSLINMETLIVIFTS